MSFNYFKILSKDDKELIHSSFLSFLLDDEETNRYFLSNLFPEFSTFLETYPIIQEHCYSYQMEIRNNKGKNKSIRIRTDIELRAKDGGQFLIIENKFKSFPYPEQLVLYDKVLDRYHQGIELKKYLLCFDPSLVKFDIGEWNVVGYQQLNFYINQFLKEKPNLNPDKKRLIEHYSGFLNEYVDKFEYYKNNCRKIFENQHENEYKFWLRLINTIVVNALRERFKAKGIEIKRFDLNPGNTSVPLINIVPEKWNGSEPERVIQFQGKTLKYYCHSGDFSKVEGFINKALSGFNNIPKKAKFGKLNKRVKRSQFIYKEEFLDHFEKDEEFGIDDIVNILEKFFNKIDSVA